MALPPSLSLSLSHTHSLSLSHTHSLAAIIMEVANCGTLADVIKQQILSIPSTLPHAQEDARTLRKHTRGLLRTACDVARVGGWPLCVF